MNDLLLPLPWQQSLWRAVTAQTQQNRLAHALLLAGPRGVGKRQFARALTAYLLCEARGEYACGTCRSCQQFIAGSHPNAIVLQPEFDEKNGKQKRDIAVEQVRDFSERLQLTSHYAQAKVARIDPADALNASGLNALLKTIEEPPGAVHVLLITERAQELAATLRSRCQRLAFAMPPATLALAWLKKQEMDDAPAALAAANGAPLRALELHQAGLLEQYEAWSRGMDEIAAQRRDPIAGASMVGKDQAAAFFTWLQQWLTRRLARELAHNLAHGAALDRMLAEAVDGQRRLTKNAPPQLLVESALILWWRLRIAITV